MAFDVHTGRFRAAWTDVAAAPSRGRRRTRSQPPNWPDWAIPQLEFAADVAEQVSTGTGHPVLAAELYRRWYNPLTGENAPLGRPLAGVYRGAHAGNSVRIRRDDLWVVDRNDVVGRDGWWRTWSDGWLPTRSRSDGVRVMFSPKPELLAEFVHATTRHMRDTTVPWLLACTTDPLRIARTAAATLYVPSAQSLPAGLLDDVAPLVRADVPPLCKPLAAGVALAQAPGNGMSFGEHRCHLVALALRTATARRDALSAVAEVFRTHGVDPAHPYRS